MRIKQRSKFLENKLIFLRPIEIEDINGNYKYWLNDPVVNEYNSHCKFSVTIEDLKSYVFEKNNSKNDLFLAIVDKKTNNHIGNIILQNINWHDRNAEIAFILGEKEYWSKGFMFMAGLLLINHAFEQLNLHRIYLGTSSKNIGMQKLALKLGFKKEGERIDAQYKNGEYNNIIEFGKIRNYEKK
jgi:ribosomal-protein-alanine N-acetyltransferase